MPPTNSTPGEGALARLLDQTPEPIYCVDSERRIVYCNSALLAWVHLTREQLLGRLVEYDTRETRDDAQGVVAALCPPPTALAGTSSSGIVSWSMPNGRLAHRRARFVALTLEPAGSGDAPGDDRVSPPAAVMVLLEAEDVSATELAAATGADPTADELHLAVRRFRRQETAHAADATMGQSAAIRQVRAQIEAAAKSRANVLVAGPDGSGRGAVARSVFYAAHPLDDDSTLLPFDCAICREQQLRRAIDLLVDRHPHDRCSALLLERLDQMPAPLGQWLLDALPSGTLPFRILATTSADWSASDPHTSGPATALRSLVGTIQIDLPSLGERKEDLPALAQLVLEDCNRDAEKQIGGLTLESLDLLALYDWPGEIAELREVIQSAHRDARGPWIEVGDLPPIVHHAAQAAALPRTSVDSIVLEDYLAMIERELIDRALAAADGNKAQAARLLGMTRPRLYRRLVQLGVAIQPEETTPVFEPDDPPLDEDEA